MPVVRAPNPNIRIGPKQVILTGPLAQMVRDLRSRHWPAVSEAADRSIAARAAYDEAHRNGADREEQKRLYAIVRLCEREHGRALSPFEGAAIGLAIVMAVAE